MTGQSSEGYFTTNASNQQALIQLGPVLRGLLRPAILAIAAGALAGGGLKLILGNRYTADTSIFVVAAQGAGSLGNIGAVAGALGVSVGGASQAPQLLAEFANARSVVDPVLARRLPTATGDSISALTALDVEETDSTLAFELARRAVRKRFAADLSRTSGIITMRLTLRDPVAAAAMLNALRESLGRVYADRRRQNATDERQSTEARLALAKSEVEDAEQRELSFLSANRSYDSSPALRMQRERLTRAVSVKVDVYRTIATAYERTRIDEGRTTPSFVPIDTALPPAREDGFRLAASVALGAVVGLCAALAFGLFRLLRANPESPGVDDAARG